MVHMCSYGNKTQWYCTRDFQDIILTISNNQLFKD